MNNVFCVVDLSRTHRPQVFIQPGGERIPRHQAPVYWQSYAEAQPKQFVHVGLDQQSRLQAQPDRENSSAVCQRRRHTLRGHAGPRRTGGQFSGTATTKRAMKRSNRTLLSGLSGLETISFQFSASLSHCLTGTLLLLRQDPRGNVIQRWPSLDCLGGMGTAELTLPPPHTHNPPPGMWTIQATVDVRLNPSSFYSILFKPQLRHKLFKQIPW